MKLEPGEAGARVAELFARSAPRLFHDLAEAGVVPNDVAARTLAFHEFEYFALFGCVRGLVAAKGFARNTVAAIDTLHARVFTRWDAATPASGAGESRRAVLAQRYSEYETISQTGGASGAATASTRLGEAAAGHLGAPGAPGDLPELLGSMHESLAEAVVAVLSGEGELPVAADDTVPNGITTPPLDGAWRIVARLERAGIEVVRISGSELGSGRGGPRCMSCPVDRLPLTSAPDSSTAARAAR